MVVTVILAILFGLALPSFSRSFKHLELRSFAQELARRATYANRRAIATAEPIQLYFDMEAGQYGLARVVQTGTDEHSEKILGQFGRPVTIPRALSLTVSTPVVTFTPDGRADAFEARVTDQRKGAFRLTTHVWTGRVRVEELSE